MTREKVVSVWIDAELDPNGTSDGEGGPIGWFDHDGWETTMGPLENVLGQVSYGSYFKDDVLAALDGVELPETVRLDVLFDTEWNQTPGEYDYGRFVGTFKFTRD